MIENSVNELVVDPEYQYMNDSLLKTDNPKSGATYLRIVPLDFSNKEYIKELHAFNYDETSGFTAIVDYKL